MRSFQLLLTIGLALSSIARGVSAREAEVSSPIAAVNRQLLLVRSPSWYAASGTLERYERAAGGRWIAAAPSTPVSIGRSGMAWGRGLQGPQKGGPTKREGDGKSPAGAFALGRAFGAAEKLPEGAHGFPYLQALASSYCVEDTRSKFYNQLIDANDIERTGWEQWSELRRADGLFDWAVVVRQNDTEVRVGAGSCVFLHIWRGPHHPTAGCTAMPRDQIEGVVRWLDAKAMPVLVQLPEPVYAELRKAWGLPSAAE